MGLIVVKVQRKVHSKPVDIDLSQEQLGSLQEGVKKYRFNQTIEN